MKKVLLEGIVVASAGALLAFAANALSPLGLKLTRNYFPAAPAGLPPGVVITNAASPDAATNGSNAFEVTAARLKARGLQAINGQEALRLFNEPARQQEALVFIDARDDQHYQAGHIPGAYQLDRFHPENYFATVLPVCQHAQQVVIYCTGGECEDSEFAALLLRDSAGIAGDKLLVYVGGWNEWTNNHHAVEQGQRNSGVGPSAGK